MVRVAVVGANGRMGRRAVAAIDAAPDLDLVAQVVRGDDLRAVLLTREVAVAVDLTTPEVIASHAEIYLECAVRPVIGTTGLSAELSDSLVARSRRVRVGGLIAPNFAIGAVLMMQFAELAAKHLPRAEIIEYHHGKKLDAPSGTALLTRAKITGANAGAEVVIHSVRMDGFLAHQEVIFGSPGQRLTIRHDSMDRDCFMPGVLLGVRGVLDLDHWVVGLEQLL